MVLWRSGHSAVVLSKNTLAIAEKEKKTRLCVEFVPRCTWRKNESCPSHCCLLSLYKIYSGGRGMIGLPMEAKEVTPEELKNVFPPPKILEKWHAGEDADWPPEPDYGAAPMGFPQLRFEVGQKVLCRIGPDVWFPGEIVQLWYRESHWPANSWAPYKIRLDDGRDIFAPGDLDQVIKVNPDA